MVELKATDAFAGALPVKVGACSVEALDLGVLTSLSALGPAAALSAALEATHGLSLPKPGRSTGRTGNRCLWFGRGEVLLAGPAPDASLSQYAALVDQSDAWASVRVSGKDAVDVLARLVPIDLRESQFKRGASARTLVQHMTASITRTGADSFAILVFRSMAGTLVHDLKGAMEAVAARR